MDKFLTAYDIAEMLQISYETSLGVIKHPSAGAVRIGRQYRISKRDLLNFLAKNKGKSTVIDETP